MKNLPQINSSIFLSGGQSRRLAERFVTAKPEERTSEKQAIVTYRTR